MGLKVLKFGGSSLADAEHFRQVAEIVKSDPTRRYVVASAPGKRFSADTKVTDLLYKCYELTVAEEDITEVFDEIVYVENGFTLHSAGGVINILVTGDLFFVKPGENHSYINAYQTKLYNLIFSEDELGSLLPDVLTVVR